jgi:hypothetical protein
MSSTTNNSIVSHAAGSVFATACRKVIGSVILTGCMTMTGCAGSSLLSQIRGDNFNDEFAHWGEKQRPPGEPGNLAGVSTEAQQVERNLGVR